MSYRTAKSDTTSSVLVDGLTADDFVALLLEHATEQDGHESCVDLEGGCATRPAGDGRERG